MSEPDVEDISKTLDVTALDNHGHKYVVKLHLQRRPTGSFGGDPAVLDDLTRKYSDRWVLRIVGTPGCWYVSDVLDVGPHLAIDAGAGWSCVNFDSVIAAAREAI